MFGSTSLFILIGFFTLEHLDLRTDTLRLRLKDLFASLNDRLAAGGLANH
jgi:hypothetical protein